MMRSILIALIVVTVGSITIFGTSLWIIPNAETSTCAAVSCDFLSHLMPLEKDNRCMYCDFHTRNGMYVECYGCGKVLLNTPMCELCGGDMVMLMYEGRIRETALRSLPGRDIYEHVQEGRGSQPGMNSQLF